MAGKASHMQFERPAETDAAAMNLLAQLERLKIAAEQAGEPALAEQVAALFDGYLTRYCDGKRAVLEESLRRSVRPSKDLLN